MFKKKYKNDILLVVVFLALAAILFAILKLNAKDGAFVKVSINGEQKYSYRLNQDIEAPIISGNDKNILIIKDGKAYVESANCPDKICVAHKKISKTGEAIICLPHKVVIEITDE